MNQKVNDYLYKQANEKAGKSLKKKNDLLIELGLYEKEYSDKKEYSIEYPESEWDSESKASKYFRKVPVEVSDEEYSEILKYLDFEKNLISIIFKVLACITFIGGFIAGIALGNVEVEGYYSSHSEFSFALALTYWSISLVSGMIFLGFAEIIQLLTDIKNK